MGCPWFKERFRGRGRCALGQAERAVTAHRLCGGLSAWVENSVCWPRNRKHVDVERNCFGGGFVASDDCLVLTLLATRSHVVGLDVKQRFNIASYFEVEITNDIVPLPCLPVVFNRSKRGFFAVCSAVR